SFNRRVIGNNHYQPRMDPPKAGNDARRWRTAPFLIHTEGSVEAKLEETVRVDQQFDTLASGQPAFGMLTFNRLGAATLANLFLLVSHLRNKVSQETHISFEPRGSGVYLGRQKGGGRCGLGGFVPLSHGSDDANNYRSKL